MDAPPATMIEFITKYGSRRKVFQAYLKDEMTESEVTILEYIINPQWLILEQLRTQGKSLKERDPKITEGVDLFVEQYGEVLKKLGDG